MRKSCRDWLASSGDNCSSFFWRRHASRIKRLIRFLWTDFLKFRLLTAKPACKFSLSAAGESTGERVYKILKGEMENEFPFANRCSIALRLFSRSFLPNVYRTFISNDPKLKKPSKGELLLFFALLGLLIDSIFYRSVHQKRSVLHDLFCDG